VKFRLFWRGWSLYSAGRSGF